MTPDATALPRYRAFIADSERWWGFEHRPGDIVISTPSKSGTTWMQMLVALVLFDGPEHFPAPVNEMSLWLDMHLRPREETEAAFVAQEHRRFIKTHVPLDGLRMRDDVTYLMVGRDPRDVWVSMEHHGRNMDIEETKAVRYAAVGRDDLPELDRWDEPEDPAERLRFAMELDRRSNHAASHLAWVLHHLETGWTRREMPNVHLFHYADLQADLVGQLSRLADILDVEMSEDRAAELAVHATLTNMRANAADHAPDDQLGIWKDAKDFFRSGGSGEWRSLVTPTDQERYWHRVGQLVAPDLARWAHEGGPVAARESVATWESVAYPPQIPKSGPT